MLEKIVDFFVDGKSKVNGNLGAVYVGVKRDSDKYVERVNTTFIVKSGKNKDLYMDVEFTEEDVNIISVTGKKNVTTADIIRVAEKYKDIVREYDSLKVS